MLIFGDETVYRRCFLIKMILNNQLLMTITYKKRSKYSTLTTLLKQSDFRQKKSAKPQRVVLQLQNPGVMVPHGGQTEAQAVGLKLQHLKGGVTALATWDEWSYGTNSPIVAPS